MPSKVNWFVRSTRAINETEKTALLEHARVEEKRAWQVARYGLAVLGGSGTVAGGGTTVPDDVGHPDWSLLLAALTALRQIVPDAQCEIVDELGVISWNQATERYETRGWEHLPAPPPPPPPAVEGPIAERFQSILDGKGDAYQIRRTLDTEFPPAQVAAIGLKLLPTAPPDDLQQRKEARREIASALRDAFAKLKDDVEPLLPVIRELWRSRVDEDLHRHVARALEPLASHPAVLELAREVVSAPDAEAARLVPTFELLGAARLAGDQVAPWLVARARDDRALQRGAAWRERLLCGLELLRHKDGFATVLLEGDADEKLMWRTVSGVALSGARALPWLLRMKEVRGVTSEALIHAIADVRSPEAEPLLLGFLDHPLAPVRVLLADKLAERKRFAEAAALWRTLDAAGHTGDRWSRASALRALGRANAGENDAADWDALVVERGGAPLPLAPLPSLLECSTDRRVEVRLGARTQLDRLASPAHLLATLAAAELEEALRRRGEPGGYASWYPYRAFLEQLGAKEVSQEQLPAWLRAHAAELPQQELTPTMQAILDGGAEAVAAGYQAPLFRLSDEERAALVEEEAAIAARTGTEAAEPAPSNADDLFDGPHPESRGPSLDRPSSLELGRSSLHESHAPSTVAAGGVVEVVNREAELTLRPFGEGCFLGCAAILRSKARWLRLDAMEAVVRDAAGAPLASIARREEKLLSIGWIAAEETLTGEKRERAATVEMHAIVREPFQSRVRWRLPPLAMDSLGRCELALAEGSEHLRANASCFAKPGKLLELDVLAELAQARACMMSAPAQVVIAIRDARGTVLTRRDLDVVLTADGSAVIARALLGLDGNQVRSAASLEVAVRAARLLREPLASFAVPPVH